MNHSYYLLVPLLLPLVTAGLLQYPFSRPTRRSILNAALALETVYTLLAFELHGTVVLLAVSPFSVVISSDHLSKLFSALFAALFWVFCVGRGERQPTAFQAAHCLATLSLLMGLCYAGNLFTFLLFFLLLAVLLLAEPKTGQAGHNEHTGFQTRLLPLTTLATAACTCVGGVLFALRAESTAFTNGGSLKVIARLDPTLRLAAALLLAGFLLWMLVLPPAACYRAQPRLPMVVGILPGAGALGMLRVIYYLFGSRFFLSSPVRSALLIAVVVLTVLSGAAALRTKTAELRLALVAASQSSCAVMGLLLMHRTALWGAMLQVCAQPAAMICLLLCAESYRLDAGRSTLAQLRGMGRQAPLLWGEFTAAALALAGLPPLAGFTALYYLVLGGWQIPAPWNWLCGMVALFSALIPLLCLGPVVVQGIWPGTGYTPDARLYADRRLLLTIGCTLLVMLLLGLAPWPVLQLVRSAAISIL